MSENTTETVLGGIVIAVATAFLLFMLERSGQTGGSGTYEVMANFSSAEGISAGSEVRVAGVRVGTVVDLDLNRETYDAQATLAVDKSLEIPDDSTVIIQSSGLLGGSFVEISPGGSLDFYGPGDTIEDTQGAISLIQLFAKFAGGGGD